jgi:hypothetical protein
VLKFVLETLIKGVYGSNYDFQNELAPISKRMKETEDILMLIDARWQNTLGIIDEFSNDYLERIHIPFLMK